MNTINLKDVKVKPLPGRDVYVLTEHLDTKNLTVGICEVPPKSTMTPHKHWQEETIYILTWYWSCCCKWCRGIHCTGYPDSFPFRF